GLVFHLAHPTIFHPHSGARDPLKLSFRCKNPIVSACIFSTGSRMHLHIWNLVQIVEFHLRAERYARWGISVCCLDPQSAPGESDTAIQANLIFLFYDHDAMSFRAS